MNTPLRRLATVVLVMFVGLMVSATWVQYVQADRLNNDSRNVRTLYREFGNARGPIVVAGERDRAVHPGRRLRTATSASYTNGELYSRDDRLLLGRQRHAPSWSRPRTTSSTGRGRPAVLLADPGPAHRPAAGGRGRRDDDQPGRAAGGVRRPGRPAGRGRRPRAVDGQDPRAGLARPASTRTRWRRTTSRPRARRTRR